MPHLLDLPREIRNQIYRYVYKPPNPFPLRSPDRHVFEASMTINDAPSLGVLLCCHRLSEEYREEIRMASGFCKDFTIRAKFNQNRSSTSTSRTVDIAQILEGINPNGICTILIKVDGQTPQFPPVTVAKELLRKLEVPSGALGTAVSRTKVIRLGVCCAYRSRTYFEDENRDTIGGMPIKQLITGYQTKKCFLRGPSPWGTFTEHTHHTSYLAAVFGHVGTKPHYWQFEEASRSLVPKSVTAGCKKYLGPVAYDFSSEMGQNQWEDVFEGTKAALPLE